MTYEDMVDENLHKVLTGVRSDRSQNKRIYLRAALIRDLNIFLRVHYKQQQSLTEQQTCLPT